MKKKSANPVRDGLRITLRILVGKSYPLVFLFIPYYD